MKKFYTVGCQVSLLYAPMYEQHVGSLPDVDSYVAACHPESLQFVTIMEVTFLLGYLDDVFSQVV